MIIMSKMKELYSEMIDAAMDCMVHGFDDDQTRISMQKEFGFYFDLIGSDVIERAKRDLAAYNEDMMRSAYSYEERV